MRSNFAFIVLILCLVSVIILSLTLRESSLYIIIPGGIGLIALYFVWRGVFLPSRTVIRGMELIKSQDFNNRLNKVGEYNADSIVKLFNEMIDRLRTERLHNREQEGFLKKLIEASPMGIVALDFNGNVSLMNQSFKKMTGVVFPNGEKGKRLEQLDNSEIVKFLLAIPQGETSIIRLGDIRVYRGYHLSFISYGFKRSFYLLESLTEEIIRAERSAYEKVIRTISHEVNNTMGGVRTVLEIIKDNLTEPEIHEVVESCEARCESMCGFISRYADVVKIPEPVMVDMDLRKEISEMMPFLKNICPEYIEIRCDVGEEPFNIPADVTLMHQVIINIIKNAKESITGKGWIELKLIREKRDEKILEISNNGERITEEISMHLFRPFFTTKREGQGIGLTLIGEILNRHGATYSLRTDKEGITRFRIIFQQ